MIELNNKTQHDFLNREWVQKLLDAGVDMSDAKYCIQREGGKDQIILKSQYPFAVGIPTYTVSELLYKLHEWIYPTIDGKEFSGGLKFFKDAPFYCFYYDLKTKNYNPLKFSQDQPEEWNEDFMADFETPIKSLAYLLILCHKNDIGMKTKDTGNIQDKYKN